MVAAAAELPLAAPAAAAALLIAAHTAVGCWPMREFATLTLGYAACEAEAVAFPFVVRGCTDFAPATESAIRDALRLEADVRCAPRGGASVMDTRAERTSARLYCAHR
jgi:hypothetical protein